MFDEEVDMQSLCRSNNGKSNEKGKVKSEK